MKKILLLSAVLISGVTLVGCSKSKNEPVKDLPKFSQEFKASVNSVTDSSVNVTVKSSVGTDKNPVLGNHQTVILLAKDSKLLNTDGKSIKLSNFSKGDSVQFALTDKPIMTMSLPPQIPGNSIKQIVKM